MKFKELLRKVLNDLKAKKIELEADEGMKILNETWKNEKKKGKQEKLQLEFEKEIKEGNEKEKQEIKPNIKPK